MNKALVIINREYLTRIRTRAFVLSTVASPVLLLAVIIVPVFLIGRGSGERRVTVLDQSGDPYLFQYFKESLDSLDQEDGSSNQGPRRRADTRFTISHVVVDRSEGIDEVRRGYNREVEGDPSRSYMVIRPGTLSGAEPEHYSNNVSDIAIRDLARAMSSAITRRKLVLAGLDAGQVNEYIKPVETRTFKVGPEGDSEQSGLHTFQIALVMLFFIYVSVLAYGISVMRGVIEEKQSRIVEVIVSSVKPIQLMMGKLIGIGMVGLTQYVIWVVLAILLSAFGTTVFASSGFDFPQLPVSLLIYFVLFFILGYFLYATLYATVGAIVSSEEEGQHVQFPVTMLIILPMMLFTMVMNNPNSPSAIALSLFPFFAPSLMIMRIAVAQPPFWQILLSILILLVTIIGVVWLASKIYRVGILMHGKRPTLAELGRWLRYA